MYKESFYNIPIEKNNDKTLLYNAKKGSLVWIEEELYNIFKNKEHIPKQNLSSDFIDLGFVVPQNIDEVSELAYRRNAYIYEKFPKKMSFVIAPTLMCNMNCKYCFENISKDKATMSDKDVDFLYDYIIKRVDNNPMCTSVFINWFGGEPTLMHNQIIYLSKKLIAHLKEKNIKYSSSITTNGLLLTKTLAEILSKECNVTKVQITVDGLKETYTAIKRTSDINFDLVIQNICEIYNLFNVHIRINVNKNNHTEVEKLIEFLLVEKNLKSKIRIYLAQTIQYADSDRDFYMETEDYEQFRCSIYKRLIQTGFGNSIPHEMPEYKIVSCGSMQSQFACIGPDLKLFRCEHCLGNDSLAIGDVFSSYNRNSIEEKFIIDYPIDKKCKNCKFFPVCAQGCRARNVIHNIPFDCELRQKSILNDISNHLLYNKYNK